MSNNSKSRPNPTPLQWLAAANHARKSPRVREAARNALALLAKSKGMSGFDSVDPTRDAVGEQLTLQLDALDENQATLEPKSREVL